MRDNFLWPNLLFKGELESNKGFLDGNYKRIIDVKKTNLISGSAFLKKITYTGKLSRNIFFSGNRDCSKAAFTQKLVR